MFIKGCPLRCLWCHNPESINPKPEIVFFENKCIGCKRCFEACETGALRLEGDRRIYEKPICRLCGACAEACYAEAQVMEGKKITVEKAVEELEKDRPFYENSNGGITISGGEPLVQREFVKAVLKTCKNNGLHTALDTSAHCKWEHLKELLGLLDLVLLDMKHMDDEVHKRLTGVGNRLILENAKRLADEDVRLMIRIPVVPSCNDTPENMAAAADFYRHFKNVDYVELLPYHRLGESKYERLGMTYEVKGIETPDEEALEKLAEPFRKVGLTVRRG